MQSSEWKKQAEMLGRLALKARALEAKQRLMAQQQRYQAIARATEKRELAAHVAHGESAESAPPACEPSSTGAVLVPFADLTRADPPEHIRSSPFLMNLWKTGSVGCAELERRAEQVKLLQMRFAALPEHARRAGSDPDYWNRLYDSRVTL